MSHVSKRFDRLVVDGRPARLGIMGGTFDPIHIGHLAVAEKARDELDLDAVLFIPTGAPVFKRDQDVTSGADRLEMCRLATLHNQYFDVSDMEIARGGDTYTVDTLHELREHYGAESEFYFITGADAAVTIGKWKGSREIASLAHLVVALRPGTELSTEELAQINAEGFTDVRVLKNATIAVSSRQIREALAAGQSVRYLVPESVCEYIERQGLYSTAHTQDEEDEAQAFSPEFLEARRAELEGRVKPKRYAHVMGVAETAVRLARLYGVDEQRAYLAGLLHDWDKCYDDDGIRKRARELGVTFDPVIVEEMPQVMHGPTAAAALAREYPFLPKDVLRAIRVHTAGAPNMTDLDMVLYAADALEPNRDFGEVDKVRKLIGNVTLEELFFATFRHGLKHMLNRVTVMHPDTIDVWNCYAERMREEGIYRKWRE